MEMTAKMSDGPIREIRPVVVPSQFFVVGPIASFFLALPFAFIAFVLSNIVGGCNDFGRPFERENFGPKIGLGVIAFFLGFAGAMVLFYLKTFVEPRKIVYRIYPNRIEYEEGLFNRVARTLMFDSVIDVTLTEGVLQQKCNAGSINLVTQQLVSTGRQGQLTNRTITLANLPEPREVYEFIKSLTIKR